MLFVLPFCQWDEKKALSLLEWMFQLHGQLDADAVAICTTGCTQRSQVYQALAKVFKRACVVPHLNPWEPVPRKDTSTGWPGGPNAMFKATCKQMLNPSGMTVRGFPERVKEHDSFYYFEPDNLPLSPDWWQKINEEYDRVKAERPCMGALNVHDNRDWDGVHRKGEHLVGTAIYPRDIWNRIPLLHTAEHFAWDTWASEQICPLAHSTRLIHHNNRAKNYCHPKQIPGECVVIHGCKDDSLLNLMRAGRKKPERPLRFIHNGDRGDIIYSLPAIKELGGQPAEYLIDSATPGAREVMTPAALEFIRPLLESQPYIGKLRMKQPKEEGDVSFHEFRHKYKASTNLCQAHIEFANLPWVLRERKWLTVDSDLSIDGRVVIARSARYQSPRFPWGRVVSKYGEKLLFVGLPEEHRAFCGAFGEVEYRPVADALQLAKIIAGSSLFIGNQSFPFAIAEGLKTRRILEVCPSKQENGRPGPKNCNFLDTELSLYFDAETSGALVLPDLEKPIPLENLKKSIQSDPKDFTRLMQHVYALEHWPNRTEVNKALRLAGFLNIRKARARKVKC